MFLVVIPVPGMNLDLRLNIDWAFKIRICYLKNFLILNNILFYSFQKIYFLIGMVALSLAMKWIRQENGFGIVTMWACFLNIWKNLA